MFALHSSYQFLSIGLHNFSETNFTFRHNTLMHIILSAYVYNRSQLYHSILRIRGNSRSLQGLRHQIQIHGCIELWLRRRR